MTNVSEDISAFTVAWWYYQSLAAKEFILKLLMSGGQELEHWQQASERLGDIGAFVVGVIENI
ncbi:hypothetical protein FACS1894170_07790 [Planctomycetales bacterium]|nr:hypothetical protein FACS1894170_07790 [Planctomycetales bacterium]